MSIFIQEVLGLLKRNQKKVTLDKAKDWFEFGKLYSSSSLNNKSGYTPKMDPFVIKWGDFICQATEDMTRTLPGQGNLGYIPVYTDPSGSCNWDTLKDSIITQNALNTIINIAGSLQVIGDVQISGGDLTATTSTFNLLNTAPVSVINFGSTTTNIEVGGTTTVVNINGTAQSTSCTTGALVVDGGVGIAKNLYVCNNANIAGDVEISGGDLTSTASNFNLLQQSTTIGFGYSSQNIFIGGISATSTVVINGTQNSSSCTTGAFRVNGGVGIGENLYVCGTTNLNGDVNLGDDIADEIYLNGTLLDNNGNAPLANQVLVGQGGGVALWQNDDVVETLTYGSIWIGNSSNVKTELPIGTTGSIPVSTGNTLSYQFITANNGLTMSTPLNSQLGGTLIQPTIIQTQSFNLKLEGTSGASILDVNQLGTSSSSSAIKGTSAGGFGGYFQGNPGAFGAVYASNSSGTPTTTFEQSNGQVVSKFTRFGNNNTGIGTVLDLYNVCNSGPAVVGLGTAINFNIEDGASTPSYAGKVSFDWTSFTGGNSSRFKLTTINQGVTSDALEVAGTGQLKLNKYGINAFTGTPAYLLATTATGEIIETVASQDQSKNFAALITQSGTAAPVFQILQNFSGITWTLSYISPGLYTIQASQNIFIANKTAVYIIPNVNSGKPYCAAIERTSDDLLLINCFDPTTGAEGNSYFNSATLKIEIYQ